MESSRNHAIPPSPLASHGQQQQQQQQHDNNGSHSYASPAAASPYYGGSPYDGSSPRVGLRRRAAPQQQQGTPLTSPHKKSPSKKQIVNKLDFMYTKVERDYTVQTEQGGKLAVGALVLVVVLCLAELVSHLSQNQSTKEHIRVDTSLGKKMRVNLNITFPALACVDLHVDAMDVAGDSQINLEDSLVKIPLHLDGTPRTREEIQVELNTHRQEQEEKERLLKQEIPDDYCGPCYGAAESEDECCQTCDDVLAAYKKKRWNAGILNYSAEQCIREGRDRREPKRMTKGQGCNLSGWMQVNRVAGNFHIAMGEGIERDGRHIHTYVPEDTPNFNASHVIHKLEFGPINPKEEKPPLNGVTKIVTTQTGTTGLFQYFIKVVPTTYTSPSSSLLQQQQQQFESDAKTRTSNSGPLETNRYYVTERFRPLMKEYLEDHPREGENDELVGVHAGAGHANNHDNHHKIENSVLPGVFFIYEIYPFAVEISPNKVPATHLLIRLMATMGGIFALTSWADRVLYARDKQRGGDARQKW